MARRQRGALEDAVVGLLSVHRPMSVVEVRSALGDDLAHTTAMTALVRLTRKGVVTRARRGRGHAYSLVADADDLPAVQAALRMRRELDNPGERADVLANFVAGLDPEDEAVLRELLDDPSRDEHKS